MDLFINIFDQNTKAVSDVEVVIKNENHIIQKNLTDEKGIGLLKIPASKDYTLQLLYEKIPVHEQKISLIFSKEVDYELQLYNLMIRIKDKLNLKVGDKVKIQHQGILSGGGLRHPVFLGKGR